MSADILIKNAKVYTVDDDNPHAEAVAIAGNQIVYVGSEAGLPADLIGDETRIVDAGGNTLLPGLIDSHFHLQWGAATLYGAQLQGIDDLVTVRDKLLAWSAEHPDAPWVIGEGVSYALPDKETPLTRHYLDRIIADRPLVLNAYDQHSMFANTKALELAGILHGVDKVLPNGDVVMGDDGLATGELYEMDAMAFIRRAQPEPDFEQQLAIIREGLAMCASLGLTSIHNMDGDLAQTELYAELERRGQLTCRVYMPFWAKPGMTLADVVTNGVTLRDKYTSDMLRGGVVKFFIDGVYESFTAVTLEAYPEQPENYGEPLWSADEYAQFVTAVDAEGLQIATHACGSGGVQRVLNGYEAAQQANGVRDSRHRVEHIEVVDAADVPRFAELGVMASMQPLHSPLEENDPEVWLLRVDEAHWARSFAWRTLREAGARLPFGSDWPVVTANPYIGMYAAINRKPWKPGVNAHVQTLDETIRGYTADGAYTEFMEGRKGQLKVGMLADLVLLDCDLFALDSAELANVTAVMTICDGNIVYEKT